MSYSNLKKAELINELTDRDERLAKARTIFAQQRDEIRQLRAQLAQSHQSRQAPAKAPAMTPEAAQAECELMLAKLRATVRPGTDVNLTFTGEFDSKTGEPVFVYTACPAGETPHSPRTLRLAGARKTVQTYADSYAARQKAAAAKAPEAAASMSHLS